MKILILPLSAIIFALPVYAQPKLPVIPTVSSAAKLTPQVSAAVKAATTPIKPYIRFNAHAFTVGISNSPFKQILNRRYKFHLEYKRAGELYHQLQNPAFDPIRLRTEIENTIVNNTLRKSLIENLELGRLTSMSQDLDQYFLLSAELPVLSTTPGIRESFALSAQGYLTNHPHKPSWQLREVIKFGDKHKIEQQFERWEDYPAKTIAGANGLEVEEYQQLLSMYSRADELNKTIKEYIAKTTHTEEENAAILATFREMYDLYDELVTFAQNSASVKNTVTIYKNLLTDMKAFVAEHNRAPIWQNEDERALYQLFEPLVFANQANQFEEIVPILNDLYALTEMYPVKRFSERDALKMVQNFHTKHGFLPRSVKTRDFFDLRPDEALTLEAMLYWKRNSPIFSREINNMRCPQEDFYPQYY